MPTPLTSPKFKLVKADWNFFRQCATAETSFSIDEFRLGTGRKMNDQSVKTYISKHYKEFLSESNGTYTVVKDFLNISFEDFAPGFRQKEEVFTIYDRCVHREFLAFEFFLPLAHERRLRDALDKLFYEDTVRMRLSEIGVPRLSKYITKDADEADSDYINRLVKLVGDTFGGYSISHVSGRFRFSEDILTLEESAARIAQGSQYLIDETTAVVRFIVPWGEGKQVDPDDFDDEQQVSKTAPSALDLFPDETTNTIPGLRALFHLVFVEAVIRQVRGEDQIWLLESGIRRRLWIFKARHAI